MALFYKDLLNLLFPRKCIGCSYIIAIEQEWLCSNCFYDLPKSYNYCNPNNAITNKLYGRFHFKHASSFLIFKKYNKVQNILHELKYSNKPLLAKFLGTMFGQIIKKENILLGLDLIIPVPLHSKKQKLRGYNQSTYFANGLSEATNIPYNDKYLIRVKDTETQTKKSRLKRSENVEFAFSAQNTEEISGKHILLVDDVITTGATLESCAKTLLTTTNIKDLSIATIAVAE